MPSDSVTFEEEKSRLGAGGKKRAPRGLARIESRRAAEIGKKTDRLSASTRRERKSNQAVVEADREQT